MSNPSELVHGRDMGSPRSCCYLPYGPGEGSQGKAYCQAHGSHMRRGLREPLFWLVARARGRRGGGWPRRARCGEAGGAGSGTWSLLRLSRAHLVERERKPLGALAASPCDMPAQLANELFEPTMCVSAIPSLSPPDHWPAGLPMSSGPSPRDGPPRPGHGDCKFPRPPQSSPSSLAWVAIRSEQAWWQA